MVHVKQSQIYTLCSIGMECSITPYL